MGRVIVPDNPKIVSVLKSSSAHAIDNAHDIDDFRAIISQFRGTEGIRIILALPDRPSATQVRQSLDNILESDLIDWIMAGIHSNGLS
jgi:hypothetical protein